MFMVVKKITLVARMVPLKVSIEFIPKVYYTVLLNLMKSLLTPLYLNMTYYNMFQ